MNPWYATFLALGWGLFGIVTIVMILVMYAIVVIFNKELKKHLNQQQPPQLVISHKPIKDDNEESKTND